MKKIFIISLVLYIFIMMILLMDLSNGESADKEVKLLLERIGISNTITGVYLQSRVYDTIFEVIVFTVAALGVSGLLKVLPKSQMTNQTVFGTALVYSGTIAALSITMFLYVAITGHISPGGGFAGGVILAGGIILYGISSNFLKTLKHYDKLKIKVLENFSLILIFSLMTIGVIFPDFSLFFGRQGEFGTIFSGGFIPLINLLIGIKVYAGAWKMSSEFVVRRGTF